MAGTDWIKAPTKKSLLTMLKQAKEITPRLLSQMFDGVVFKNELKGYTAGGAVDHGSLTGLTDDDHSQYLLTSSAGSRALFTSRWTDLTDSGATTLHKHDHGGQDGLADDDHTQYLLAAGTRALTGDWAAGSARKITVGSTWVGDGTNDVRSSSVGVYLTGTATMWDDLRVAADATKLGGSKDPNYLVFKTDGGTPASRGVFIYWFDDSTEEELYFSIQMPHAWKEGSSIYPHVHWVAATTAGGAGTDVCWGLEYTWANINATFGNTNIIYADTQTNGAGETITAGKHYLTAFAAIAGTGKTLSSMLICRLFRDAGGTGGTDDLVGDAGLLEFDLHYEIDSFGSKEEYVKGP